VNDLEIEREPSATTRTRSDPEIRSHGSDLRVGASPGGGARFSFDLEVVHEDES